MVNVVPKDDIKEMILLNNGDKTFKRFVNTDEGFANLFANYYKDVDKADFLQILVRIDDCWKEIYLMTETHLFDLY